MLMLQNLKTVSEILRRELGRSALWTGQSHYLSISKKEELNCLKKLIKMHIFYVNRPANWERVAEIQIETYYTSMCWERLWPDGLCDTQFALQMLITEGQLHRPSFCFGFYLLIELVWRALWTEVCPSEIEQLDCIAKSRYWSSPFKLNCSYF